MGAFQKLLYCLMFLVIIAGCTKDSTDRESTGSLNNLTLGASANDLLSDEKYTSLIIEMVYVTDFAPSPTSIAAVKEFLEQHTYKPDGISVVMKEIPSPGKTSYSVKEDIVNIEKDHRTQFTNGDELAVFIFFADGKSSSQEDSKLVLGTAYRNTSMVIFEKTVRELATSTRIPRSDIETTTIEHEFGHLFGLVDNGSPAQSAHEDPESKSHCNASHCLMVASVEFGSGTIDLLKSSHGANFDESCLQDLRANGAR